MKNGVVWEREQKFVDSALAAAYLPIFFIAPFKGEFKAGLVEVFQIAGSNLECGLAAVARRELWQWKSTFETMSKQAVHHVGGTSRVGDGAYCKARWYPASVLAWFARLAVGRLRLISEPSGTIG